jgi:lipoprotein NlpI
MTKWPVPMIRLYLEQLTPDAVLAAADDSDANTKKGRVGEAIFYGGELALQKGGKDDAVRQFKLATAGCQKLHGMVGCQCRAQGARRRVVTVQRNRSRMLT